MPQYFAYSGHRGMRRVLVDLKDDEGREAFLSLAAAADVVVESFRPGVVDRLGIGYSAVSARNPGVVYCSTSGYGQDGPASQWAGHDIDYLAVGGYLAMSTPGSDGAPPLAGRHRGRRRGRRHAGGAGHHGGAGGAGHDGTRRVSRRVGGRGRAVADVVGRRRAAGPGGDIRPGHDVLSGRYACYGTYAGSDGKWLAVGAIEAKFFANLCAALGCPELAASQLDDDAQPAIRAAFAAAFATRTRDEWVAELAGADTCVAPVLEISEVAAYPQFVARGRGRGGDASDGG